MRRPLLLAIAGLVALVGTAGGVASEPASGQNPPSVGIRIVDVPSDRVDDPRARLYIVDHLAPNTSINRRVEVSNSTGEPQTVQVYAAAASVTDGAFQFGEGHAVNDLVRWTTVDPPSMSLQPQTTGLATVTIVVPADARAGEQYGVVWAELSTPPPPGGGVGAVNRVGVRMYLSVGEGGEPASDFEITAFQGQRAADGSPTVTATVHNTGGRALDLSGELQLTNGPGGLSAGPFNATLGTALGVGQTEPVLVALDKALPNGPWTAKIMLRSGTTTREASGSITFPVAAGTSSGKVLTKTDDGGGGVLLPILIGAAVVVAGGGAYYLRGRHRQGAASSTTD